MLKQDLHARKGSVCFCVRSLLCPVLADASARSLGIWCCAFNRKPKSAIMTPVGFEPTQLALVELESTPLDHSGKVSLSCCLVGLFHASTILLASAVARSSVHAECDTQ